MLYLQRSFVEEGSFGNELHPEDMLADEYDHYQSEEEHYENKRKEKQVGLALFLDIPLRPPPATPDNISWSYLLSSLSPTHSQYLKSYFVTFHHRNWVCRSFYSIFITIRFCFIPLTNPRLASKSKKRGN